MPCNTTFTESESEFSDIEEDIYLGGVVLVHGGGSHPGQRPEESDHSGKRSEIIGADGFEISQYLTKVNIRPLSSMEKMKRALANKLNFSYTLYRYHTVTLSAVTI